MVNRKKIVFMIDVKPLVSKEVNFCLEDAVKLIRFSILRILTYFGGTHKSLGGKSDSGPLWGFKFYKSSGGHLEYGNHHLLDLKLKDFQNFEEELEDKFMRENNEDAMSSRTQSSVVVADQISCALAEVVAGFQWERPDFFSPVKSNRKVSKEPKEDNPNDKLKSNFVFLFTPCPSCCGDVNYFSNGNPANASDLRNALMKEEVHRKIINECKISFNWIDISRSQEQKHNGFHEMLTEMMTFFSGSLVPIENMSFWWVENRHSKAQETCQPGSFGTFMDSVLSNSKKQAFNGSHIRMSMDAYRLTISLNGICSTKVGSAPLTCLPVILRNATLKDSSKSCTHSNSAADTSTIGSCCKTPINQDLGINASNCNAATIKGVFKSSAGLLMLQDIQESYYCSFDHSQHDDGIISDELSIFQQLLKILKTKRLILVLQLNHPEHGHPVNACLQPWTYTSGVLTILSSTVPIALTSHSKCNEQTAKYQVALIEGLITNIRAKLDRRKSLGRLSGKKSGKELSSDLKDHVRLPVTSSFMQSFSYWFSDLPSHSLPLKLHEDIERIQNIDAEAVQRINQTSTALFKKLKDYYKDRRCYDKKEAETSKAKDSSENVLKLKSRTFSRTEHMIAKSKVKMKKKSEDEIKEKERNASNQEADCQEDIENEDEADEDPSCGLDILINGRDLSSVSIVDLSTYIKSQIADVLTKDLNSCEAVVKRLSRTVVLFLNKFNQRENNEKIITPDEFLETVFIDLAKESDDDRKSVKVARQITRVLMDLEMAALLKLSNSGESESAIKRGGNHATKEICDKEKPELLENISKREESSTSLAKQDENGETGHKLGSEDSFESEPGEDDICPVAERSIFEFNHLLVMNTSQTEHQVIEQLRPLIFLEDPGFLAKYLNSKILQRFKTKIPNVLREVYEGLGQQTPMEILTPSKRTVDADDSLEVIDDSDSTVFSDYGSNNPSNHSGASFRRFLSIGDSMARKRQIIVPVKGSSKSSKKRNKKRCHEFQEPERMPKPMKEGWCRNLFETGEDEEKAPPVGNEKITGSRKRKLQRRYSEMGTSVKDTPASKQRRHFFWKKQHKARRKTDCITNVTVIEESPLKDCRIEESPIKPTASSRFLSRSQSFNCKTSPRRFYAPRRFHPGIPAVQNSSPRKSFGRSMSCLTNSNKFCSNDNIEDSNQKYDNVSKNNEIYANITTPVKSRPAQVLTKDSMNETTPRKENCFSSPRKRSMSVDSSPLPAMICSPTKKSVHFPSKDLSVFASEDGKPKQILDLLEIASATNSFGFDTRLSTRPLLYSEDSMDWVAMIENDRTQHDEADESPLPVIDSIPSLRGSETESVKGNSPNIFTPIQEGKQPFSSPFLSASSLETLENAPILSPRLRGSKSNRELSCRKRIKIATED